MINKEIITALVAGATASRIEEVYFDGDTLVIDSPPLSVFTMDAVVDALERVGVTYGNSFIIEYLPATKKARLCIPEVKI